MRTLIYVVLVIGVVAIAVSVALNGAHWFVIALLLGLFLWYSHRASIKADMQSLEQKLQNQDTTPEKGKKTK